MRTEVVVGTVSVALVTKLGRNNVSNFPASPSPLYQKLFCNTHRHMVEHSAAEPQRNS